FESPQLPREGYSSFRHFPEPVMPQLVGTSCVLCGGRIDSILEGKFCSGCRYPVHHHCIRPGRQGAGEEGCSVCGGKLSPAVVPTWEQKPAAEAPLIPVWVSKGFKFYKVIKFFFIGPFAIVLGIDLIFDPTFQYPNKSFKDLIPGLVAIFVGVVVIAFGIYV